jgi:hypothetical protein
MDKKIKQLHPNLKKFVNASLDLIDLNRFFDSIAEKYNVNDGYHFHIFLVVWFLNLEIHFDQEFVPNEFQNVKFVRELPKKEIKDCLFYLNYILGTTVHTGGFDYCTIYQDLTSSGNRGILK